MAEPQKKISLTVLDGRTELAEQDLESFFSFFRKSGRNIFFVIAIAALGSYGFNSYKKAQEARLQEGAAVLSKVQQLSEQLSAQALKADSSTDEKAKLIERLGQEVLQLRDAREPYSSISVSYDALLRFYKGDFDGAKTVFSRAKEPTVPGSLENLAIERAKLLTAQLFLEKQELCTEGINSLRELAERGASVNAVAAASVLAKAAQTADEKKAAAQVIESLLGKDASLEKYLREDLAAAKG